LLGEIDGGFALTASYAEGIAQPTFFDLYGFFPGNFVGNPSLKSESSRGWEAGARYRRGSLAASLTGYRQRLHDEIVDIGDLVTFLRTTVNRDDTSQRWGIEAEASWRFADKLRLSADYAFLHATEPDTATGQPVTEHRRPKHSGSIVADGAVGRWSYGASIAYVGSQLDARDNFPFDVVRLHPYWLAGARVAYALRPGIEVFARGSNLFDSKYQDSVGYRTEGRGLFAGIRLSGR
jgi:vitamin B12 transporter